jgi:hypothetical protein
VLVNRQQNEFRNLTRNRVCRAALILKAKTRLFICSRAEAKRVFLDLLTPWPDEVYSMDSLDYEALHCGDGVQTASYFERVPARSGC